MTTRETTISQLHEVQFGASRTWLAAGGWRIALSADVAPTAQARLTTILPDKYPGQEIVFSAVVFSLAQSSGTLHCRFRLQRRLIGFLGASPVQLD